MTVSTNNYQIGVSGIASQNFHLTTPAIPDGSLKLYRGNVGAPIGSAIVDVSAAGDVAWPGDPAWTTVAAPVTSSGGALASASATFSYRKIGRVVMFRARASIVDNGTGSGFIQLTMPFSAAGSVEWNSTGRESVVNGLPILGIIFSGGNMLSLAKLDLSYPGATGAILNVTGLFESTV